MINGKQIDFFRNRVRTLHCLETNFNQMKHSNFMNGPTTESPVVTSRSLCRFLNKEEVLT